MQGSSVCRILIVDNTANSKNAQFTPQLIKILSAIAHVTVVTSRHQVFQCLNVMNFDGAILSGSQHTLTDHISTDIVAMNAAVLQVNVPVLGICFGMQCMALLAGAHVQRLSETCKGIHHVVVDPLSTLMHNECAFDTYHEHDDAVFTLPQGYRKIAKLANPKHDAIVAFENDKLYRYGVQFHPEAESLNERILQRFVDLCIKKKNPSLATPLWFITGCVVASQVVELVRRGRQ
mgnify:CR=1 FL=1